MELEVTLGDGSFYYDGAAYALPEAATSALSGVTVVEYSTDEESWTDDLRCPRQRAAEHRIRRGRPHPRI